MMTNTEKKALSDHFFYPRSVAVIGVSADENAFGTRYLRALLKFGFNGKLYPVNPRGGSLLGLTVYPSMGDIPDSVDLAVISVPGRAVPGILESCLTKGIKTRYRAECWFQRIWRRGEKARRRIGQRNSEGYSGDRPKLLRSLLSTWRFNASCWPQFSSRQRPSGTGGTKRAIRRVYRTADPRPRNSI